MSARYIRDRPFRQQLGISRPWAFQKTSWAGLLGAFILPPLVVTLFISTFRPTPRGLLLHLHRPEFQAATRPDAEPLLVRVESDGRSVVRSLYFGSQRVSPEDFDRVLRESIAIRPPNWPVYIEGEPGIAWGPVAQVVDKIRGLHTEVVLLKWRNANGKGRQP